jgi:hypothetical protein
MKLEHFFNPKIDSRTRTTKISANLEDGTPIQIVREIQGWSIILVLWCGEEGKGVVVHEDVATNGSELREIFRALRRQAIDKEEGEDEARIAKLKDSARRQLFYEFEDGDKGQH